jgi:hypothetical protein
VAELLRRAGLQLLPGGVPADPVPLYVVSLLPSCRPEDGRRDAWVDGWVDEETPGLVEQANGGWFSLVSEYGLFGREREFLLGVPVGDDEEDWDTSQWRRVRLLDAWDLFGVGAGSGLLGSAAGRPEFRMSSLDGGVAVRGTTYEKGVTSIVVAEPWRAPTIRTHMEHIVDRAAQPNRADVPEQYHDWARAWVRYVQHRSG